MSANLFRELRRLGPLLAFGWLSSGPLALAGALALSPGSGRAASPQTTNTQPAAQPAKSGQAAVSPAPAVPPGGRGGRYRPDRFAGRAGTYYKVVWGVDSLAVKWGESGEVIRFTYRVLDAERAQALNDHEFEPSLIDPQAGVKLVVPSMENVGQLRQSAPPENGKSYWMVFSNKGRLVKRGDHVSLVIGPFRADGLVVD
jgi:hypothetical protein